jgi:hypothetical protein
MANIYSLCNDIEQFLQQNDQNSINQFLNWIQQRLNISSDNIDKSVINTSQIFRCQCGHRYSLRFSIIKDEFNEKSEEKFFLCHQCQIHLNNHEEIQSHNCEQRKIDELKSLEQLIPPDTIEQEQTNRTHFGLPKLTDSMVEIIHPDGKRQFRCPLCFNSYVNRSGLNRHYITHSSQDLWKVG